MSEQAYKIDLGIHDNIAEYDYHRSPGISKHGLDLINRSPAHYKQKIMIETQPLIFGGGLHCFVLEPDKFDQGYIMSEFDDFRTKAAREWKAKQNEAGRRVLSKDDIETINIMADKLANHPVASILLDKDQGKAEQSAYWIDNSKALWKDERPTYRLCRCRADFINFAHNLIIDLKTTTCAGLTSFTRDVVKYRYHVQDAFYRDGLKLCGLKIESFVFIAIEKEPPYNIGVYELSRNDIQLGRDLYQRDLLIYHKAMTDDEWPGYSSDVRLIELPQWAYRVDIF